MLYTYQLLYTYNGVAHPIYKNQNSLGWPSRYEKPFFAQLATEHTCAVDVADIATFVESFYGKCVGSIRKGRMNVL